MLIFRATLGHFFKDSISWAGCPNNPIYVNLHLPKVWKVLIKNQLKKVSPLMPIRVRGKKVSIETNFLHHPLFKGFM
jgi:hypothetical protein